MLFTKNALGGRFYPWRLTRGGKNSNSKITTISIAIRVIHIWVVLRRDGKENKEKERQKETDREQGEREGYTAFLRGWSGIP
ncbi:MAG: hypothetical protein WA667_25515 [Candidatus Nitrosopolaris sp.]